MVAPVGSNIPELEIGAEKSHLLFKKFKYTRKGIVAPKSRDETQEMSAHEATSSSSSMAATTPVPPEAEPPVPSSSTPSAPASVVVTDGRAPAIKSPSTGIRTPPDVLSSASGDGKDIRASPVSSPSIMPREKPAYMIRWNRFEEQVCNAFSELFCSDHFVDVTLACDGEMLKAHKIVLAMSSPFFRRIFQETPCKHPVVIIKGMTPKTLRYVLQYIYMGEVTLNKEEINNFMDAADYLSICGVYANLYSCDISTTIIREESRPSEDNENDEMEQDYEKPTSSKVEDRDHTVSESEGGGAPGPPSEFRDDSQSEEDKEQMSTESNVIKYHGIKNRWSRRYSSTSYHGSPTISSPVTAEHKRSASAGEVVSTAEASRTKLPRTEPISESANEMDVLTPTPSGDGEEKADDRSCVSDDLDLSRDRRIIQRAYPKFYRGTFEDSSDQSADEVKSQPAYSSSHPSLVHVPRSSRGLPYAVGGKDFSHPLQVSVDSPSHPSVYSNPSSIESRLHSSGGVIETAVLDKSHSGFTMYATSPQSLPPHRSTIYRTQSESEFPITSSPMSLVASHNREERSAVVKRQFSSATSSASSLPVYRHHPHHHPQQHPQPPHHGHHGPASSHDRHTSSSSSEHHHPHARPSLPLLSTQGSPWGFPEHQRSRSQLLPPEESSREMDDIRFRSNSLERDFAHFGGAKDFLSHVSQLRGVPGFGAKQHSFSTATDLSVSNVTQQYSLGLNSHLRSPSSSSTQTRPKTKAIRSSQVPQSARYTAAEVDQMVDAVANYPGNIVPCTLCQKFVKRERLRAHIHECHLLSGEKIICPHCGIALKSKGSFRVHIWRHKRGALPTRNTMTDFGRDRPPSPRTGPASH